jgi:hypothetical protein
MARGTGNEFTGNGGICCSAALFINIENHMAGLDDYTIDDMRKDADTMTCIRGAIMPI